MIPQESLTIELKSSFNAECIETLVAFVNAKGGSLYVGVNDDGNVVGVNIGKETIVQWINEIKGKTEPSIVPDVEVQTIDNKQVVVLFVKEFPIKPVSVKGKYFKRVGNSNHLLNLNEMMNMHIQTFNSSWDYYIDNQHFITDISEEKAIKLIALYNKNHIIPAEYNVYEFLSKMELIRDGKLTNAGFLLLMKNDFAISDIELGHFYDPITIKDGITISTDLITEVDEVMAFVMKHVSKAMIITGNPAREDRWEYPLDAIREIVMNMIIHRDYTHFGSSSIKIFPDRIEFFNPGHLPDNITAENLRTGEYVSTCRNKIVAKIFKEINWIEKYGSGIARVKRIFEQYGSPLPVFEEFQHGFKVTALSINTLIAENVTDDVTENVTEKGGQKSDIKSGQKSGQKNVTDNITNVTEKVGESGIKKVGESGQKSGMKGGQKSGQINVTDNITNVTEKVGESGMKRVGEKVGEKVGETISKNQKLIVKNIFENQNISSKELSEIIGISARKIEVNIAKLKKKGFIERIGPDKGGYWKIIKKITD
ncbi:MAG: putative DNA binding domain-containing protein [Prevotellaceae bacterium]|jgi:ATP-dependent DNA helicase RecG|nr:putative DNA binding domain-containing protein [Prevotellaceae bacterium]